MLKPSKPKLLDPLKIYMNAELYRTAYSVLYSEGQKNPHLMTVIASPHMVLSAFASELYLKCLLCVEGRATVPQTHNLKALFRDLSVLSRDRIEQLWNNYSNSPGVQSLWRAIEHTTNKKVPQEFSTHLALSSRAFDQLRYSHEDDSGTFLLGDLPEMLRSVILERRPLWATLRHAPPTSRPHEMPTQRAKEP